MEGLAETETGADLTLGGVYENGEIVGGLTLPVDGLASFIATNSFDGEIVGLSAVPEDEQPPVNIVRFSFQTMVFQIFSVPFCPYIFLRHSFLNSLLLQSA